MSILMKILEYAAMALVTAAMAFGFVYALLTPDPIIEARQAEAAAEYRHELAVLHSRCISDSLSYTDDATDEQYQQAEADCIQFE